MIGSRYSLASRQEPADPVERSVRPELLEMALRRRVEQIEELLERLRRKGLDVERLLETLYRQDGKLRELWAKVNSDIIERSAQGKITMEEALSWIDALEEWAELVSKRLRRLAGENNGNH